MFQKDGNCGETCMSCAQRLYASEAWAEQEPPWPHAQLFSPNWSGAASPAYAPNSSLQCFAVSDTAYTHNYNTHTNKHLPPKVVAHEIGILGEVDRLQGK
ncbi:hypothetical protein SLE2022_101350 [Rubroshorea leprosula]